MNIVIDCNRVFAALLKNNTTRKIILNKKFQFYAPEYISLEIEKYQEEIIRKLNIKKEEFKILLGSIFEKIIILPLEDYQKELEDLLKEETISDKKDFPYLALAMAIKAEGIWTHDPDFRKQNKVKIFTNIHLLNKINS